MSERATIDVEELEQPRAEHHSQEGVILPTFMVTQLSLSFWSSMSQTVLCARPPPFLADLPGDFPLF